MPEPPLAGPARLFVYGTLRPSLGHPAGTTLAPYVHLAEPATLDGQLFHLGRYPGFVAAPHSGTVRGELLHLAPGALPSLLRRLDAYEGDEYTRRVHGVRTENGSTQEAWVYELCRAPVRARIVPGGDWAPFAR